MTQLKWDDYAKNDIQSDENIISISGEKTYLDGKKIKYNIIDLDNDEILFGQSQYNGKARITYQSTLGNISEKIVLDAFSGIDKNFDTQEDNQILALSWEKSFGGKSSAKATFKDADGDNIILDRNKELPSMVDIALQIKNPPLSPFVDSIFLQIRVLTIGNGNDTIIRFSGEERRISGRRITLQFTDIHGNPDVIPFDTAIAIIATQPVLPNGWKDSIKLIFDVQSGLQNSSDNLLYELHINKEHQKGIILRTSSHFVTTQPISQGEKPKSGHIEMSITFTDNKNASLIADFSKSGFSGTYTDPKGNTLTIIWDANGNVVSSN